MKFSPFLLICFPLFLTLKGQDNKTIAFLSKNNDSKYLNFCLLKNGIKREYKTTFRKIHGQISTFGNTFILVHNDTLYSYNWNGLIKKEILKDMHYDNFFFVSFSASQQEKRTEIILGAYLKGYVGEDIDSVAFFSLSSKHKNLKKIGELVHRKLIVTDTIFKGYVAFGTQKYYLNNCPEGGENYSYLNLLDFLTGKLTRLDSFSIKKNENLYSNNIDLSIKRINYFYSVKNDYFGKEAGLQNAKKRATIFKETIKPGPQFFYAKISNPETILVNDGMQIIERRPGQKRVLYSIDKKKISYIKCLNFIVS